MANYAELAYRLLRLVIRKLLLSFCRNRIKMYKGATQLVLTGIQRGHKMFQIPFAAFVQYA